MKKLPHFYEVTFIANMDPGCYVPLILSPPATHLLHTWQMQSRSGQTHSQRRCRAGHFHCLPLWSHLALRIILVKAHSLSLSVTSHTATIFIFKALLMLLQPYPPPLTGYCGVNHHLQPLKLNSITYFFFFFKSSLFFLQWRPIGTSY